MVLNDKVLAHTDLIKCRLVGHVVNIIGDVYVIRLCFPIRGVSEVRCKREQLQLIPEKVKSTVTNRPIRKESAKIIQHLEAIAQATEEREHTSRSKVNRIIPESNSWLDYMRENDIE